MRYYKYCAAVSFVNLYKQIHSSIIKFSTFLSWMSFFFFLFFMKKKKLFNWTKLSRSRHQFRIFKHWLLCSMVNLVKQLIIVIYQWGTFRTFCHPGSQERGPSGACSWPSGVGHRDTSGLHHLFFESVFHSYADDLQLYVLIIGDRASDMWGCLRPVWLRLTVGC